jgi:hypothetical protein
MSLTNAYVESKKLKALWPQKIAQETPPRKNLTLI